MAGNNTAVVKVLADNADLTRKLAQSERKLKGFERAANRAGKNTKGTFAGLTRSAQNVGGPVGGLTSKLSGVGAMMASLKSPAALAAGGFAAVALAAKGLQEALDVTRGIAKETNKLKRETGLSAQAASGYLAIADRFGISAAKLSTQFGFLSKRMKAASGDTKGAATALAQFADAGVSEATVKSGDLNRVLVEAADKFAAMKDGPAKTALAMQLFGRSGKDLLPILNQGGSGIEALQEKMRALGLTIGEDTVKQNKELGKATKDLSQVMRGFANDIGTFLIPRVSRATSAVSEAVVAFRTGKKPTSDLQRVVAILGNTFGWLGRHGRELKSALLSAFNATFPQLTALVRGARAAIRVDWGGLVRSLKNGARSARNSVVSGFGSMVGFVKSIPSRLSGLAGRFASAGAGLGRAFINNIGSGLSRTGGFLSDLGNQVRGWINRNTIFGDQIKLGPISVRIPALAAGGVVSRPTLALIGEAGPEAVVPLSGRNGRRAQAAGFGGGQTIQNFTINTTGPVDEQALARSIGWQLATRGLA